VYIVLIWCIKFLSLPYSHKITVRFSQSTVWELLLFGLLLDCTFGLYADCVFVVMSVSN
jgi:hypothetical protein